VPLTDAQVKALADDVVILLGVGDDPAVYDQAKSAVYLVTTLARGYTRGVGFAEGEDGHTIIAEGIQSVITTAAARLTTNPQQSASESESSPVLRIGVGHQPVPGPGEGQGPEIAMQSMSFTGGFTGFTEVEKAILHQYRLRNG